MELSKVALEKRGDCHVKRAQALNKKRILLLPFPSQQPQIWGTGKHRMSLLMALLFRFLLVLLLAPAPGPPPPAPRARVFTFGYTATVPALPAGADSLE